MKWLAFQDEVDWDAIALVVHRDAMADIPALVAATDVEVSRVPRVAHKPVGELESGVGVRVEV